MILIDATEWLYKLKTTIWRGTVLIIMNAVTGLIISCLAFSVCGLPIDSHIVGGQDAPEGQYPYQASLKLSTNNANFCGGAIINNKFIITAAHCLIKINDPSQFLITIGSVYLDAPRAVHEVAYFITHPNYNSFISVNDIALIRVLKDIEFNENVQPISLPAFDRNFDGFPLIATGWGRLWGGGTKPNHLQMIIVRGYPRKECNNYYKDVIVKEQICTLTTEGKGMCHGDSGGPLVADGALIGIVSFGTLPCGSGSPDVYTKVFNYKTWIHSYAGI